MTSKQGGCKHQEGMVGRSSGTGSHQVEGDHTCSHVRDEQGEHSQNMEEARQVPTRNTKHGAVKSCDNATWSS